MIEIIENINLENLKLDFRFSRLALLYKIILLYKFSFYQANIL